jgi:hypothetical protein
MTSEQADFYKRMQDLTAWSVSEQTLALQRYNDLLQRLLRGELNDPQVREDYLRFVREETTHYMNDLAQLSLGYYSALLELGRNYNDRFFEQVLRRREPETHAGHRGEAADKPRQVMLDLRGAAGEEIVASFLIENKNATQAEISFVVSDCVDVTGGSPFKPPLQLFPAQFSLGPLEEVGIKIRLPLVRELFIPGHQYLVTVVVRGYDELELIIRVAVDPVAETAAWAPKVDSFQAAAPEVGARAPAKRRPRGTGSSAAHDRGGKSTSSHPRRNRAGGAD